MVQLLNLDHARDEVNLGSEHYVFELSEDAKESTFGSRLIATISSGPQAGKRVMLFTNEKVELYSGDVLEADCVLSAPKDEYLAYYDQKNIAFSGSVSGFQTYENQTLLSPLYQLRKQLLAIIGTGSDEQTLLRAILLGERTGLFDASFYHSIKVAGLAHLVAVSGAHLVIVTGFVTLLLKKLRVPRKLSVALQTLFLVRDAEAEVLEELNEEHLLEPVDLYKVGHHGSRKAITPELARVLSPKVSLIGVGKNSYGHPTDDALNALESVGSEVYRSDQDGDVVCTFSPNVITLTTQNKLISD